MKKMGLVALMALLCLPMGALAVREGVIEDAPMVEARRKTSYLPMHRVVVEETGWMLEEAYTEVDTTQMIARRYPRASDEQLPPDHGRAQAHG